MGAVLALVMAVGCGSKDSTTPSATGTIELRTDGGLSVDVQSARLFVGGAFLKRTAAGDITVSTTKTQIVLQGPPTGTPVPLASKAVPPGTYTSVRLTLDSAEVVLPAGRFFADSSSRKVLRAPALPVEVVIAPDSPLDIAASATSSVIVSVDGIRAFGLIGPSALPTGVQFAPAVRAVAALQAGAITGSVSPAGTRALVFAIRGADTVQSAVAEAGGGFTLRYLPPGGYIAAARAAGFQVALSPPVTVTSTNATAAGSLTLTPLP